MTEYKSIREWIAEGVNPVGYVDEDGRTVQRVALSDDGDYAWVGSIPMVSLDYLVAPPAPKRLSDEDLLDEYDSSRFCNVASEVGRLRTQILDRMKARGPTRGEVGHKLYDVLDAHKKRVTRWSLTYERDFRRSRDDFLSMFPEGEE